MKSEKDIKRIFADKDAFRREVSLARVQVEGLSRDELASALAYELEPYSKIPALEADVAWRDVESPDGAMLVFDVALVRRRSSAGGAAGPEKFIRPLSVAAVALILALCGDYAYLEWRINALEDSLATRAPLQRELDDLAKRASGLNRQTQDIRSSREAAQKAQRECAILRAAFPGLLEALSVVGGRVVVKSLVKGKDDFSLEFTFAAADGETGNEAMTSLSRELAKRGWSFETRDFSGGSPGALVEIKAAARFL